MKLKILIFEESRGSKILYDSYKKRCVHSTFKTHCINFWQIVGFPPKSCVFKIIHELHFFIWIESRDGLTKFPKIQTKTYTIVYKQPVFWDTLPSVPPPPSVPPECPEEFLKFPFFRFVGLLACCFVGRWRIMSENVGKCQGASWGGGGEGALEMGLIMFLILERGPFWKTGAAHPCQ